MTLPCSAPQSGPKVERSSSRLEATKRCGNKRLKHRLTDIWRDKFTNLLNQIIIMYLRWPTSGVPLPRLIFRTIISVPPFVNLFFSSFSLLSLRGLARYLHIMSCYPGQFTCCAGLKSQKRVWKGGRRIHLNPIFVRKCCPCRVAKTRTLVRGSISP